ncbi:hypothetical protein HY522_04020 [bacterium]|nr:hypothetical protein [bacterium]
MNGLLVRVGADLSPGGGSWNGPVCVDSGEFVYVAIPENRPVYPGMEKPYTVLRPALAKFGVELPLHLQMRYMHLDPDFEHLTYGDSGERAKQLRANLRDGDLIVFYAGLADTNGAAQLVYALVGLFVVNDLVRATDILASQRDTNAHSRRVLPLNTVDIIVRGRPRISGRFRCCIPIGDYRDRAYRVRKDLLKEWGGLSVKDGYLQRSARLPRFFDSPRFMRWLERQGPSLVQANN